MNVLVTGAAGFIGHHMVHRLALHGIAPWREPEGGSRPDAKRMIAYFRPDVFPGRSPRWWLERP